MSLLLAKALVKNISCKLSLYILSAASLMWTTPSSSTNVLASYIVLNSPLEISNLFALPKPLGSNWPGFLIQSSIYWTSSVRIWRRYLPLRASACARLKRPLATSSSAICSILLPISSAISRLSLSNLSAFFIPDLMDSSCLLRYAKSGIVSSPNNSERSR